MKTDISRNTFDPARHFSRVLMQQGRVQLDADSNEQTAILVHYLRTLATDLIGAHGGPINQCGFEIIDAAALVESGEAGNERGAMKLLAGRGFFIAPGRYYVDGLPCENEERIAYAGQRDYPLQNEAGQIGNLAGRYLVYLDVWERHISADEDASIADVALGGTDTSTRAKVVWQVKLLPMGSAAACGDGAGLLHDRLVARTLPRLRARIEPAGSHYRGQENQLYRVEIHSASDDGRKATFKWSRENGSVTFPILGIRAGDASGRTIVSLAHLGRDARHGLAIGDWVELADDDYTLGAHAGKLLQVHGTDASERTATLIGRTRISADPRKHPLLRRWDHRAGNPRRGGLALAGDGAAKVVESRSENAGWLNLEHGVQIQFQPGGIYRTGDYWMIPARTADGGIEWPGEPGSGGDCKPAALPPHGIVHHYAPLAIVSIAANQKVSRESDCRFRFAPMPGVANSLRFPELGIAPDWPE